MSKIGYSKSFEYELNKNIKSVKYTPKEIVRRMVAISFRQLFSGENRKKALKNIRIIDISCGSGNFLIEVLNSLIRISKTINGKYSFNPKWITGYDIDRDALDLCRDRVQELLNFYRLKGNIDLKCENSLISDFADKYDIVIGNPPYIGEKNNREVFKEVKDTEFGKKYYQGKMDYFYFFVEKGIEILKDDGILTYITTNYWLKADYASILRKTIKENMQFTYIEDMNQSSFKLAKGQHNIIYSMQKDERLKEARVITEKSNHKITNNRIFDYKNNIILAPVKTINILENIYRKSEYKISDIFNVNQGIVSGCDKAFVFDKFNDEFKEYLRPFYKCRNIHKYFIKDNEKWILYINQQTKVNDYVLEHLSHYREKLEKRREVRNSIRKWYELQWGRTEEIFTGEKIITRQRNTRNNFAYHNGEFYSSADIYYITRNKDFESPYHEINMLYILGYLNSSTFYEWFYNYGKKKGDQLELYATPIKETPLIYEMYNPAHIRFIEDLVKLQIKNPTKETQYRIDRYFKDLI